MLLNSPKRACIISFPKTQILIIVHELFKNRWFTFVMLLIPFKFACWIYQLLHIINKTLLSWPLLWSSFVLWLRNLLTCFRLILHLLNLRLVLVEIHNLYNWSRKNWRLYLKCLLFRLILILQILNICINFLALFLVAWVKRVNTGMILSRATSSPPILLSPQLWPQSRTNTPALRGQSLLTALNGPRHCCMAHYRFIYFVHIWI